MIISMSPGKAILLGEHGVIYGKPCLSIAISLKVALNIEKSNTYLVNNIPIDERKHTYIKRAIDTIWDQEPLSITTYSKIPSAGGLGSSAAITTACVAGLLELKGKFNKKDVAKQSFEIEYDVQNGASPNDTSVCTYGGGILTWEKQTSYTLWNISKNDKTWNIHKVETPELDIVIANTGIKSKTPHLIKKIKRMMEHSSFGLDIINEMEHLVLDGKKALEQNDIVKLGEIMNYNQKLLYTLGASSKEIERLIQVANNAGAFGAKLTGAGGGGSIIALTDKPKKILEELAHFRAKAHIVHIDNEGVKILK